MREYVKNIYIMRPSNSVPKVSGVIGAALMTIIASGMMFFISSETVWISYILAVFIGFNLALIDVQMGSFLQLIVPQNLLGRVFSSLFILVKSLLPMGLLILGFLGNQIGIRWLYLISPVICLVISLLLLLVTPILKLKVSSSESQKDEDIKSPKLSNDSELSVKPEISQ